MISDDFLSFSSRTVFHILSILKSSTEYCQHIIDATTAYKGYVTQGYVERNMQQTSADTRMSSLL